jgi:cell division septation protein DedD
MTPPEQPAQEPVEQAAVETATDQSETQDSEAFPAPEPTAKPVETPEAPVSEPEPEKQAEQPATPDPMPEQQPTLQEQASAPSTTEPEPEAKPAPKPSVPQDAKFTIQVGSYRNKTNAENMMALLSRKGYEAYIFENTDAKARPWYVVRFGHFPARQAAQRALSAYEDKEQKKGMIARSGVR